MEIKLVKQIVTRVCKLDESLSDVYLPSKYDKKQASRSLTLAMMTLAARSIHLINGDGDDQKTYAVVFWLAIMFDSMSAIITASHC